MLEYYERIMAIYERTMAIYLPAAEHYNRSMQPPLRIVTTNGTTWTDVDDGHRAEWILDLGPL